MKRLFNLLQWAALLAVAIYGVRAAFRPVPPPARDPAGWSSWNGFCAIAYRGVTRDPGPANVTPRQLAAHLDALRAAGYATIRPADALAFLQGRAPLPDKALLLLFEGGRKDGLIAATPLLRRTGFVATMAVPTALTRRWGSFYVHDSDLRRFLRDPHWDLASMGHEAVLPIDTGDGREGFFLAHRRGNSGRGEDDAAFRARIEGDVAEAARLLHLVGATNALPYVLPPSGLAAADADPLAPEFVAAAVAARHPLAFNRTDDAFNGPDTDPRQLTRLVVPGAWDAATLLAEIERAAPRAEPVRGIDDPDDWSFNGAGEAVSGTLRLESEGTAWLRGSGLWSDLTASARIARQPGATALLYARFAGPHSHVRIAVDDAGVRIQEKLGRSLQTLAMLPARRGQGGGETCTLALRLKGNRLWIEVDGRDNAGPLPLARATARGRLGFDAREGSVEVSDFQAGILPRVVALAPGLDAIPDLDRRDLAVLAPAWWNTDREPALAPEQRLELLRASADGIEVVPRVDGAGTMDAGAASAYARDLAAALGRDVAGSLVRRIALPPDADVLAGALRTRGFGIVRIAGADDAARLAQDGWTASGDACVFTEDSPAVRDAVAHLLHRLPAARMAMPGGSTGPMPGVGLTRSYP